MRDSLTMSYRNQLLFAGLAGLPLLFSGCGGTTEAVPGPEASADMIQTEKSQQAEIEAAERAQDSSHQK